MDYSQKSFIEPQYYEGQFDDADEGRYVILEKVYLYDVLVACSRCIWYLLFYKEIFLNCSLINLT